MKKAFLLVLSALFVWSCNSDKGKQTEWIERENGFQQKYQLEQLVVLSRHNIRTPLVGKGSALERLTNPTNQWFQWEDPASHLTAKGQRLEQKMGTFFHEWLSRKDILRNYSADKASFRFYANAKQRTQLTARTFANALLPDANPDVEMKVEYDTMDPVFTPQITKLPDGFVEKAEGEIAAMMGNLDEGVARQYALIERAYTWMISAFLENEFDTGIRC